MTTPHAPREPTLPLFRTADADLLGVRVNYRAEEYVQV
jgi:hypothetical protein